MIDPDRVINEAQERILFTMEEIAVLIENVPDSEESTALCLAHQALDEAWVLLKRAKGTQL